MDEAGFRDFLLFRIRERKFFAALAATTQDADLVQFAGQLERIDVLWVHGPDDVVRRVLARGEPLVKVVADALAQLDDGIEVELRRLEDDELETVKVDHVLALTGRVGDPMIYRQLQVHECYATGAPMKLAAALLGQSGGSGDCLQQKSLGPDTLRSPEPGFFIVGSKSYGRRNDYLLRVGWQQVDEILSLLE